MSDIFEATLKVYFSLGFRSGRLKPYLQMLDRHSSLQRHKIIYGRKSFIVQLIEMNYCKNLPK
jgi:hypothetical protein